MSLYDKHVVQGESWDWDSTVQLFSAGLFATTTVVSAKRLKGDVESFSYTVGNKRDSNIRNRIGNPVSSMDKTYEMALNPELYANEVAKKYGINLKGSGQKISISYNPELVSAGKTRAVEPTRIEIGPSALVNEEELANTIAHELNHVRSFLKGGNAPEWGKTGAYPAGNALAEYIRGDR